MFYNPEPARGWDVRAIYDGSIADESVANTLREMSQDPEAAGYSDVGIRNMLFALAISVKPRRVLEIGTHIGSGSVVIGHALRSNGYGKLLSLEPSAHYRKIAEYYLAKAGLSSFVEIVPYYSHDEKCKTRLRAEGPFDLIFIDGSHQYDDVMHDLRLCTSLLHDNGLLAMHDVGRYSPEMDPTRKGGPRQALYDFSQDSIGLRVIYFEHPLWLNPCGMALLCKQRLEPAATPSSATSTE